MSEVKCRAAWGKRLLMSVFLAVLGVTVFTGCKKQQQDIRLEEGEYIIYYLNSAATKLIAQPYKAQAAEQKALVEELMDQLLHVPKDLDCQPALSDKVTYQGSKSEDQVLYLYFDMNYTSMKSDREILCRAALARTMTQIDGIAYVSIYCGDQPLMDSQGNPVGVVSAGDFIMNMSNVNAYEKTELTLYFADETGNYLVEEKREVVHNINTSLEQLIVEQLIAGPTREGRYPVVPPDCKILSISVTDNVCYINFDSAFLSNSQPVNEYIPFYAIVDTLTEVTSVAKVQFMINGSQDAMFRDVVPLNVTFERNQDYILTE